MTQLAEDTARQLAFVDEFWFGPSTKGTGLVAAHTVRNLGPSLSGLKVSGKKSRSRLMAALAAGLVVVLAAGFFVMKMSGGAKGQVFQYSLAQGQKQVYDLSITLNGVAAGVPDAPPLEGPLGATLGYEVVSKQPDGSTVVEFTLENLRSDPPSAFGQGVPEGSKLRVTIAPNGSVTKAEGIGGVFGAVGSSMNSFSSLPGSPSDTAGSQFMFPQYPTNEIAPGDGWNEETKVPLPFGSNTVTVQTTGTHNGFEDDPTLGRVAKFHHAISAPMDMEFSFADLFGAMGDALGGQAGSVPPEAANAVMKITGSMSMDADSLVVPDTSELLRLDGAAKMSMRMVMEGLPDGAGPPGDLAFDMTMKITLLRVDGAAANDTVRADDAPPAADAAAEAEEADVPTEDGPVEDRPVTYADQIPASAATVPGSDGELVPGTDPAPASYGDDPPVAAAG
jgi:hypothetical protein